MTHIKKISENFDKLLDEFNLSIIEAHNLIEKATMHSNNIDMLFQEYENHQKKENDSIKSQKNKTPHSSRKGTPNKSRLS